MRMQHSLAVVALVAGLLGAAPARATTEIVNETFTSPLTTNFTGNSNFGVSGGVARLSASLAAPFVGAMSISFDTVLNATYTVSYDLRRTTVLGGVVTAFIDGGIEDAAVATGSWITHDFSFIGTGFSTTLAFLGIGARLDNVKVVEDLSTVPPVLVPGPIAGAGLPLLLGFAGYAAWRRRRQAA